MPTTDFARRTTSGASSSASVGATPGDRGQYWTDSVIQGLGAVVDNWVGGHFEFVELAVLTDARGHGTGGALHDALLAGLSHERALLGTSSDPHDPAVRLYRSRGWDHLGLLGPDVQVMGKRLMELRG